jgi:hypothetical protein
MKYALAFKLVKKIHKQSGDRAGFDNLKVLLDETIPKFKTYDDWEWGILLMPDSDTFSMQQFDESVKVIYKLMAIK